MKKHFIFFLAMMSVANIVLAQFVSVKNGDWSDPKTWSINPESTAIPDSYKDVVIQHYVVVYRYDPVSHARCKNLTILPGGSITSYSHGEYLEVDETLLNYGNVMPSYDFTMVVKGDFVNHGIIKSHYLNSRTSLTLYGDLINNGSFRSVTDLTFQGNGNDEHVHKIKSMNDSTIFLANAQISDALGKVVVDSVARLSSPAFDLNDGRLVISSSGGQLYANNLNVRYGTLEANGNTIRSESGALVLGVNYSTRTNTYVSNAVFDCTVSVGGGSSKDHHAVFLGENTVRGLLEDWYQGSVWTDDNRGLRIIGKLVNEGEIRNATVGTGRGLMIHMEDGSEFINKNDSLLIKAMIFDGHCKFSNEKDTLDVQEWVGTDSNTVVELTHSVWFDQTINIDLKGGKLMLPENGIFRTLYMWYNRMNNTRVEANGASIHFSAINENCTLNEANILGVYLINNTSFTGKTTIENYLIPYEYCSPIVTAEGDFENKGVIRLHPNGGSFYLHLKANAISNGTEWNCYETRLNGTNNQSLIIPGTSFPAGAVYFDAMISGSAYQWQKNGVDIPGATASVLAFATGINASHFGVYTCVVDGTQSSRKILIAKEKPLEGLQIRGIVDVPADQGGWVHVNFEADVRDKTGAITFYGIWQWKADQWISMGHVPAIQKPEYAFLAHTYHDSTALSINWSKFYITAHTTDPLVYYSCPVDSGYSIDNLIPAVPTGLQGVRTYQGSELSWNANPDPDIQYYIVYRDGEFLAFTEKTSYVDGIYLIGTESKVLTYTVAAVDFSGNKSAPSTEIQLVLTSVDKLNSEVSRLTNTPNPVVNHTIISFELVKTTNVQLKITDLSGKQVALLIDQVLNEGTHQLEFSRSGLPGGVYLCHLITQEGSKVHRMLLQ